jgi:hypothetical protein
MYALVIDETITKYFSYPKGFTLNGNQYPADIFTKWSVEEKEALGIYEVVLMILIKKMKPITSTLINHLTLLMVKLLLLMEQLLIRH